MTKSLSLYTDFLPQYVHNNNLFVFCKLQNKMQEVLSYFCLKLSGLSIVTKHSQEADSDLITTKDDFADKRIGNLIIYS